VAVLGVDSKYAASPFNFTYQDSLILESVEPSSAIIQGRITLTIHGKNFISSADLVCKIGEAPTVAAEWVSNDAILCIAQVNSRVTRVTVSNNGEDYSMINVDLESAHHVAIDRVVPSLGKLTGGTEVTLIGISFRSELEFRFGSHLATSSRIVSSSIVLCIAPARWASSEALLVLLRVGLKGMDESLGLASSYFQYVSDHVQTSIWPPEGPLTGGTIISVTGVGFSSRMSCRIGSDIKLGRVVSSTRVLCQTAARSAASVAQVDVSQ
jgi:hypothetical protein